MSDVNYNDEIESNLNREVDRAMDRFNDDPEEFDDEEIDQNELVDRITRISGEISTTAQFVLPRRRDAVSAVPTPQPADDMPQDESLLKAAKQLLIAQAETLLKHIRRL